MTEDDTRIEVHTLLAHYSPDGVLESAAVTVEIEAEEESDSAKIRVHYDITEGTARIHHFVVGDEYDVFEVADLRCVPIASTAVSGIHGVVEVEPAERTFERMLERGRALRSEGT